MLEESNAGRVCMALLIATLMVPSQGLTQPCAQVTAELEKSLAGADRIQIENSVGDRVVMVDPVLCGPVITGFLLNAQPTSYPIAEVKRIKRVGNAAGVGAKVGGAIGVAAGTAIGLVYANGCFDCAVPMGAVPAGALFGVAGGLVGAVVGRAIATPMHRWNTSYKAPRIAPVVTGKMVGLQVEF